MTRRVAMYDSRLSTLITAFFLTLVLTSCAPYRPASGKAAVCNQLNSQIIFNGSTSDTRQANIQAAEAPMVARTFENDNCI